MTRGRRPRQVGDVVRAEIARILREEIRDPGIGFATITAVEMTPDLRSARVFVSVYGDEDGFVRSVEALNHAAGRMRGIVGRNCGLRVAPQLQFVADRSVRTGARIEELLKSLPPVKPADDGGDRGPEGDS